MKLSTLTMRYSLFAVISTTANLAVQRLLFSVRSDNHTLLLALFAGAGAGLVVKYLLDKRWIFNDQNSDVLSHTKKFSLYTLMGFFTTAIFWGFETGFWLIWRTEIMREAGAIIGLSIGYIVKYQLDRRFVFTETNLNEGASA